MLDYPRLAALALESGFSHAAPLDASTLRFLPEVRDMCAADKCNKFNRSWSCPPACGTLEEMRARAEKYTRGILVQTVAQLEDGFDFEGMADAAKRHGESFDRLVETLSAQYPGMFPMSAGGCSRCAVCTYPDAPCRFPERLVSSMEACGLLVSQVCTDNGAKYNHGKDTLAYTACFLLE
ncbi:MAG: DUF2284 domain-containing protein [Oscillospiraceae bacterium]|jgi:predicted metal-binding protein|nr:DUF2284 domain-containing protein [Oscillospiraceae bacterium]